MGLIYNIEEQIRTTAAIQVFGTVCSVSGFALRAVGLERIARIGQRCRVHSANCVVLAEVVSSDTSNILILPFGSWDGIAIDDKVELLTEQPLLFVNESWIGSVVDCFGNPFNVTTNFRKEGPGRDTSQKAPPALSRRRLGKKLETKIRCVDVFTPICRGQRIGVFAGSGVGKSTLLSMFAKNTNADVIVIALVGERGREVNEFLERDLGEEGMKRAVIVVSTSDEPALQRRQAAFTAMTIAEHFRGEGRQVLLLFDSITRFASAQREIGLAREEPPTNRGYPPSVFWELSKLLERSGPGIVDEGDISAVYTVLVDGDDFNDPISDSVRGTLDGHIVLDRAIADQNRFPAINVQKSISRSLPDCHTREEQEIMNKAKRALARYSEMAEIVTIGAYREGSDPGLDSAIKFFHLMDPFLDQRRSETMSSANAFESVKRMLVEAGIDLKT